MISINSRISTFRSKFILTFLLFSILYSAETQSQTKLGISTGINYTSLSGLIKSSAIYSASPGLILGLSGEFNITKDLKIVFQPGYIQRNGKISYDIRGVGLIDSFKTKLNYINLPVFLKIPALNKVAYFNSGFSTSFLGSSNLEYLQKDSADLDLSPVLKTFDISMLFGVGATIHISKKFDLDLEGRYTQSLISVTNGEKLDNKSLPESFRFSGFQFITNLLYTF